ncbi:hypothetical protein EYF80_014693 [Liparis tanakae]|uniref:Uncharacterized protein n=1 Tax=Liparis tanakae TaxID=230148 RepID=A0A4Z2IB48_9TELE|nr:hypothetical protein EYF80_014693 [Liparis tanakae]
MEVLLHRKLMLPVIRNALCDHWMELIRHFQHEPQAQHDAVVSGDSSDVKYAYNGLRTKRGAALWRQTAALEAGGVGRRWPALSMGGLTAGRRGVVRRGDTGGPDKAEGGHTGSWQGGEARRSETGLSGFEQGTLGAGF